MDDIMPREKQDRNVISRSINVMLVVITVSGLLTTSTYPGLYTQLPTDYGNGTLIERSSGFNDASLEKWFRVLNGISFFLSLVTISIALSLITILARNEYNYLDRAGKRLFRASIIFLVLSIFFAYAASVMSIFLYVERSIGWACFAISMLLIVVVAFVIFVVPLSDTIAKDDIVPAETLSLERRVETSSSIVSIHEAILMAISSGESDNGPYMNNQLDTLAQLQVKRKLYDIDYINKYEHFRIEHIEKSGLSSKHKKEKIYKLQIEANKLREKVYFNIISLYDHTRGLLREHVRHIFDEGVVPQLLKKQPTIAAMQRSPSYTSASPTMRQVFA
jgi:hypothetical protein